MRPINLPKWCGTTVAMLALAGTMTRAQEPTTEPPDKGTEDTIPSGATTTVSPFTITFFSENDSAYYKPNDHSDRQYSSGNGVALHHQPAWAQWMAPHMPFADQFGPAETGAGYFANHFIHTPDNITINTTLPTDRPYSGHFNFGTFWQRVDPERTTMDHIEVALGFVGPSTAGEPIQKWIHRVLDAQEPMAWHHQLVDEVTFNVRVRKKWRVLHGHLGSTPDSLTFDVIPQAGFGVGTVRTDLNAQVTGRIGFNMPVDFGPACLLDLGDATIAPPNGLGFYLYGSAGGALVLHDLYLDGTVFRASPVMVDSYPLVGTFRFGIQFAYAHDHWSLAVAYAQTSLTEEFATLAADHAYGSWTVALEIGY